MLVLILLSIWKQLGFNMVVAGLQAIPPSLYEAAELDGADAWQQFCITLPGLQPTLVLQPSRLPFYVAEFEQVYVITGGGLKFY